jgi:hypothetical protein
MVIRYFIEKTVFVDGANSFSHIDGNFSSKAEASDYLFGIIKQEILRNGCFRLDGHTVKENNLEMLRFTQWYPHPKPEEESATLNFTYETFSMNYD